MSSHRQKNACKAIPFIILIVVGVVVATFFDNQYSEIIRSTVAIPGYTILLEAIWEENEISEIKQIVTVTIVSLIYLISIFIMEFKSENSLGKTLIILAISFVFSYIAKIAKENINLSL